jgi:hypothetical protein
MWRGYKAGLRKQVLMKFVNEVCSPILYSYLSTYFLVLLLSEMGWGHIPFNNVGLNIQAGPTDTADATFVQQHL